MDHGKAKKKNHQGGEGPIRIDHSEVYFENDRLSEELGIVKDVLSKYKHRQVISRDDEIKEMKRNLVTLETMKKYSHHIRLKKRPQTTPAYLSRPEGIPRQATFVKLNVNIPRSGVGDDDSSDDSSDIDSDCDSSVLETKPTSIPNISKAKRPVVSMAMTKASEMKMHLEHRKFPQKWYTEVLEASSEAAFPAFGRDAGKGRSKSAGYGKRTRRKPSSSMPGGSRAIPEASNDNPTLVCSRSKSAVLSRRKLMQMTNLDHVVEPEEKVEPVQAMREINRVQNERLQIRIKTFLESLEDVKKRREAARLARKFRRMTTVFGGESGWFNDSLEPPW